MSETPYLDRIALAQSFTGTLGAARGRLGSHMGSYPAEPHEVAQTWTPERLRAAVHGAEPEPSPEAARSILSGRTRDYTRAEHDRSGRTHLERVMGYDRDSRAIREHFAMHHPGVYRYLQEGRSLSDLDDMHHTDHERHVGIGHAYETPDHLEHPDDQTIGDIHYRDVTDEDEGHR